MALSRSLSVLDLRYLDFKIFPYLKKKENLYLTKSFPLFVVEQSIVIPYQKMQEESLSFLIGVGGGAGRDRFHHSREKMTFLELNTLVV